MPDTLHRIRIFVSCPDEMYSQLSIIDALAQELSPFFEDAMGVTLKVLDWKADIAPGVDTDPQARVNAQLNYDIYIGLLGTKFGKPTPRAGSGTEDEFQQAYKRFKENTTSVRLLFYFKTDVSNVHAVDLEEFRRVQAFRSQLTALGVLYGDYTTASEFESLLRQHLRVLFSNEWNSEAGT